MCIVDYFDAIKFRFSLEDACEYRIAGNKVLRESAATTEEIEHFVDNPLGEGDGIAEHLSTDDDAVGAENTEYHGDWRGL